MTKHIVVIGAGIVGASTAWELLKDGHRVTIIEPESPGGRHAASYGNGAWISPASIVPMSTPDLWRKIPGMLLDPNGPLTLRWTALPALMPWLLRFLVAGMSVENVEATARALATLLRDGPQRHLALAHEIGHPQYIRQTGLIYAYTDRAAFSADAFAWRLRRDNGLRWTELNAAELGRVEPDLKGYDFAAFVKEGAHCIDPGGYVGAIVQAAVSRGASLKRARASGFVVDGKRLAAVTTDGGSVPCDRAVICTGVRAKELASLAGDRIFLESERGYHAVIACPAVAPRLPIMPSDGRQANTLTTAGLRLSGQVELARPDAPPKWERAEVLVQHALRSYPALGPREKLHIDRWMGDRPSTPDGRPVIGPATASSDIVYGFGHGHIGLAAGPVTGSIVAALVAGKQQTVDITPFDPRRFW